MSGSGRAVWWSVAILKEWRTTIPGILSNAEGHRGGFGLVGGLASGTNHTIAGHELADGCVGPATLTPRLCKSADSAATRSAARTATHGREGCPCAIADELTHVGDCDVAVQHAHRTCCGIAGAHRATDATCDWLTWCHVMSGVRDNDEIATAARPVVLCRCHWRRHYSETAGHGDRRRIFHGILGVRSMDMLRRSWLRLGIVREHGRSSVRSMGGSKGFGRRRLCQLIANARAHASVLVAIGKGRLTGICGKYRTWTCGGSGHWWRVDVAPFLAWQCDAVNARCQTSSAALQSTWPRMSSLPDAHTSQPIPAALTCLPPARHASRSVKCMRIISTPPRQRAGGH